VNSQTKAGLIEIVNIVSACLWALAMMYATVGRAQGAEVKLAWDLPATNTDGTAYQDHAYVVLWHGPSSRNYLVATNDGPGTNFVLTIPDPPPGAWATTNLTVTTTPATFSVTWSAYSGGWTSIYIAATVCNTAGRQSEYSVELVHSYGAAVSGYELAWWKESGGATGVIQCALAATYTGTVTNFPRTLLRARPYAVLSDGRRIPYGGLAAAIPNAKPSTATNLRVTQ